MTIPSFWRLCPALRPQRPVSVLETSSPPWTAKPAKGLTTSEVADLLKGPKGTVVHIGMLREGYADPIVFTVTRDEIPKRSLDAAFEIRPGIGYVQLAQGFNEDTDTELKAALKQLDAPDLDGLIIDLRGNPGGLLNEAVSVADIFLDRGQLIVSHHGRSSPERRYVAIHGNLGLQVPLVFLVNGGSASASEIVSGAMQDHDRALIVGEQTFGKGLVQTVSPLSEGTGLALTTARYYTPSGRLIQRDYKDVSLYDYLYNHKNPQPTETKYTDGGRQVFGGDGITPDVKVELPKLNAFQQLLLRRDLFYPISRQRRQLHHLLHGQPAEYHQGFCGGRRGHEPVPQGHGQGKNPLHRGRHHGQP